MSPTTWSLEILSKTNMKRIMLRGIHVSYPQSFKDVIFHHIYVPTTGSLTTFGDLQTQNPSQGPERTRPAHVVLTTRPRRQRPPPWTRCITVSEGRRGSKYYAVALTPSGRWYPLRKQGLWYAGQYQAIRGSQGEKALYGRTSLQTDSCWGGGGGGGAGEEDIGRKRYGLGRFSVRQMGKAEGLRLVVLVASGGDTCWENDLIIATYYTEETWSLEILSRTNMKMIILRCSHVSYP